MVLALLSGWIAYASFAPIGLWWCAPISLAILMYVLSKESLRQRLLGVLLFGLAFFGPLLSWSNTYVGDMPWLILTFLQIVLLLPLAFLRTSRLSHVLLFPSLWIGVEYVRTHFPFHGFGWGRLAFGQAEAPYAEMARIGGAPLVGYMVCLIAVIMYLVYRKFFAISGILLIVLMTMTLIVNISHHPLPKRNFAVLAVQGGVPSLGLDFNSRATAVFENHLSATVNYLISHPGKAEVVLWPENAIDVDPFKDPIVRDQLQSVVDEFKIPFIVGAVLQNGSNFQNASILWNPKLGPASIYIKRHLTPFGEYIPMRTMAELVSPYAKRVVDFLPGDNIVIHHVESARFAPIICFELLDDASGRQMAKGSNAFVIQTNSATFGLSAESEQQLAITRIRSIEHQRYSVSVSTSGISALIDPRGKVWYKTGQNRPAVIDSSIGLENSISFTDKHGAAVEGFLIFLPFGLVLANRIRTKGLSL